MSRWGIRCMCAAALSLMAAHTQAGELEIEFDLPSFDTADYNKPYVAIWVEHGANSETLLLWHLNRRKDDKWLPDIRRWWRKIGRYGDPVDAVTGATRGPGRYREVFEIDIKEPFTLLIEVVREDGGRTLHKQPIDFGGDQRRFELSPDTEIGATTITLGDHQ